MARLRSMSIVIWVTTACNLQCTYCYEGIEKENVYLNGNTADKIIIFIKEQIECTGIQQLYLNFHGGEPLLNMIIIKSMVKEIKKLAMKFEVIVQYGMTTNGVLLDDSSISFLSEHFQSLSISIDGIQSVHDYNRIDHHGKGTYAIIMKNTKKLLDKKSDIRIRMTITAESVDGLFNNIYHLINNKFKTIVPVVNIEDQNWNIEKMNVLFRELERTKKYMDQLNDPTITVGIVTNCKSVTKKSRCMGGKSSMHISCRGDIYPCVYTMENKKYLLGNVVSGIDEHKVENVHKISNQEVDLCIGCTNQLFCDGPRCLLVNEKVTGYLKSPSPVLCQIEHVKRKLIGVNC
jgi:uncharacterized protein